MRWLNFEHLNFENFKKIEQKLPLFNKNEGIPDIEISSVSQRIETKAQIRTSILSIIGIMKAIWIDDILPQFPGKSFRYFDSSKSRKSWLHDVAALVHQEFWLVFHCPEEPLWPPWAVIVVLALVVIDRTRFDISSSNSSFHRLITTANRQFPNVSCLTNVTPFISANSLIIGKSHLVGSSFRAAKVAGFIRPRVIEATLWMTM
jgi:hypothetical protein